MGVLGGMGKACRLAVLSAKPLLVDWLRPAKNALIVGKISRSAGRLLA
jgi:hypothetical protein